jgi:hypothetical protein
MLQKASRKDLKFVKISKESEETFSPLKNKGNLSLDGEKT